MTPGTRDIDILLIASFAPGLSFQRTLPYTRTANRDRPAGRIEARSIATVIEVKDNRPEDVRFVGTRAEVRYREGWKDASEQNERQVHAVRGYLSYHRVMPPYITQLLWLRNVPHESLPPRPHPLLGTPVTWELILNVIAQQSPPAERDGVWVLDAEDRSPGQSVLPRVTELFSKVVEPTRLDRLRMERATQRAADVDEVAPVR